MKTSQFISLICGLLLLFCITVISTSWATKHTISGGQRIPENISTVLEFAAATPSKIKLLADLLDSLLKPKGVKNIYENINPEKDALVKIKGAFLIPKIDSNGLSQIVLVNLSGGQERKVFTPSEINKCRGYSDVLVGSDSKRHAAISSRNSAVHPYLSKDGILTYAIDWNDLICVDIRTSAEKWRIFGAFHHSLEVDHHGNFWTCAAVDSRVNKNIARKINKGPSFLSGDQLLVNVSKDGRILKSISVYELLVKSGLEYLIFGVSNPNLIVNSIHLNQITPIVQTSETFTQDHLLVSLRNLSTVLIVDPEKKSIVWSKTGPWMNQHCVQQFGEGKISILDNHSFASGDYWRDPEWETRIVTYDLKSGKLSNINLGGGLKFQIPIGGRAISVGNNQWMLTDESYGSILVFDDERLVAKWSNEYPDGTVGMTSWSRFMPENQIPDDLK